MRVTIETSDSDKKGRSFEFELVAYLDAPALTGASPTKAVRPLWAVAAVSHGAAIPVRANLLNGRKFGKDRGDSFELLKSAPYQWETQRVPEGVLYTIYQPEYMVADPGFIDPDGINFVVLPTVTWLAAMQTDLEDQGLLKIMKALKIYQKMFGKLPDGSQLKGVKDQSDLYALAPLFGAYLDRRTRVPLIQDTAFRVLLLLTCLDHNMAHLGSDYYRDQLKAVGVEALGYKFPLMFHSSHEHFEKFAAELSRQYLKLKV